MQYRLRGDDERGRGPMVVCLDARASMAGDKEIWSKAVALTLLDVARRERRRFRAILFLFSQTGLYTLDLNRGERWASDLDRALDLADYFAGGGTDFEQPLDAAVDCLGSSRLRRGDVVLITDGECRVGDEWKQRFLAEKKRRISRCMPSSSTSAARRWRPWRISRIASPACRSSPTRE